MSSAFVGRFTPRWAAASVFVISLAVYLGTLSPSFGFVDKGEMAAVAATLGIAHPTGYPTLMLLGYLFTAVMPFREIVSLNVLSALLAASGAGVLTVLIRDVMARLDEPDKSDGRKRKKKKAGKENVPERLPDSALSLYAGLAALGTSLTTTWWSQGNSFEVYSLHLLMMPLVLLTFLQYVDEQSPGAPVGFSRRGLLFSVVLGISFTNHLTTVLLAPALLVFYFFSLGLNLRSFSRLLWLVPGFLVGLLPYVWLPLRASMNPLFNWGDPSTLAKFIDHVTGRQYRVWMFTNPETFRQQTSYFLGHLPAELAYIGLPLALLGIYELARSRAGWAVWHYGTVGVGIAYLIWGAKEYGIFPYVVLVLLLIVAGRNSRAPLALLASLLFVTCVGYAAGFDIMEIHPYYATAVLAIGIWMAMGLRWLHRRFGLGLAAGVAVGFVLLTGAVNYSENNETNNTTVENMTRDVLETLPENALILSAQWDFWVSGSWYMQSVEGLRPDVIVIDPELMRRSWYLGQLDRSYPQIMEPVRKEEETFRRHLYKFERLQPYDAAAIQSAYTGLVNAIIDKSMEIRPVLVTGEIQPELGGRYMKVPNYLAFRLMAEPEYLPQDFPDYRYEPLPGRISVYTTKLAELYASATYARAVYEADRGRQDLAERYLRLALSFDPGVRSGDIPMQPLDGRVRVEASLNWFQGLRDLVR